MGAVRQPLNPDTLETILFRGLQVPRDSRLIVAYSGGRDSQVLLHCLSRIAGSRPGMRIVGAHYDHGLHPDSAMWAERCHDWAREMGVEFVKGCAGAALDAAVNQEARARQMRYRWLDGISCESDMVLTAHHADDQAETFLMNLLKGKGVDQLSGVDAIRPLVWGSGTLLVRPLLGLMRASLEAYARRNRLEWIEDPSNRDERMDRNYLRHSLLPILYRRRVITPETLNRGSAACRVIRNMQLREGAELLQRCSSPSIKGVFCLTNPLRITPDILSDEYVFGTVLRMWIHAAGKSSPSNRQIRTFMEQVVHGRTGHARMDLVGNCVRYYSQHLFLTTRTEVQRPLQQGLEDGLDTLCKAGLGMAFAESRAGMCSETFGRRAEWKLVWRYGNLKMRLPDRKVRSAVRRLQQKYRVPPWERHAMPSIMLDDEIIWLHGVGVAEGFRAKGREIGFLPYFSWVRPCGPSA